MTADTIPVFRPRMTGPPHNLLSALESGWWGTGPRVAAFEQEFARMLNVKRERCLMLNSCTAALHLAVKLYPDARQILVPALTFISTALAGVYENKRVRFVDVGDDLCIDQDDALDKLKSDDDVVIAVHLGGHVAGLEKLRPHCRIVEDCAHALGSYEWRPVAEGAAASYHVGTDAVSCFSFQATKGLPIGDGGMLVLSHESQRSQAEAWAWCGIGQGTWQRQSDKYRWAYDVEDLGYKYRANDVSAALALDQWPGVGASLHERRRIAGVYTDELADLPWLELPRAREGTQPNWQEYTVRTDHRDALQQHLSDLGIATTVHYYPINLYPLWESGQELPFTEQVWKRILTIPCFAGLTGEELERVIDGVRSFSP